MAATPQGVQGQQRRRGRGKKKRLILVASKCEDRQWRDYREAVYPLLLRFGCFDSLMGNARENAGSELSAGETTADPSSSGGAGR